MVLEVLGSLEFLTSLMFSYYYIGAFIVGLLSSVSIFLPSPAFVVIFLVAPVFNPFWLGIAAGIGAAVGELTGYATGYAGEKVLLKKYDKSLKDVENNFSKYKPAVFIFLISLTPFPFDFIGIFCGVIKYPIEKFFTPLVLGKVLKYLIIAYAGFYGISSVMHLLG
jgi:membrane protein YqaA with SNARE-associated domain